VGGDPGQLARLEGPAWVPLGGRRPRPTRVSEAKRPPSAKTPPLPTPSPAAQAALVDRILKGQSKIGIDVSSFTPNPAVADTDIGRERKATGDRFKAQYEGYLKELAATPVGFKLLSELDQSKHKTTIVFDLTDKGNHTSNPNGIDAADKKKGDAPTIQMNPNVTHFNDNKGRTDQPWMSEREKYGFYHELVHAWHITRGTQATGSHNGVSNSEWQATGFGPHADPQVNENAIRKAFGKAVRPTYNDVTH
jgi:Effector protein